MRAVQAQDEQEEDAPESSRRGLITGMAAKARDIRDAVSDETPPEGVPRPRTSTSRKDPTARKQKRPGWAAFIIGILSAGPGWGEFEKRVLDGAINRADAIELGELRGRLDEQSKQIRDMGLRLTANTAADLEASFNGALEFRHLDSQISALGRNIDLLMTAQGVPAANRSTLAETPVEITDRHDAQIREWRLAKAKAEREALERSIAAGDTVGP
jgi:hypothetical protein